MSNYQIIKFRSYFSKYFWQCIKVQQISRYICSKEKIKEIRNISLDWAQNNVLRLFSRNKAFLNFLYRYFTLSVPALSLFCGARGGGCIPENISAPRRARRLICCVCQPNILPKRDIFKITWKLRQLFGLKLQKWQYLFGTF